MALPVNLYEVLPRWMPLARYHMPLPECRCRMPECRTEGRKIWRRRRQEVTKKYRQVDHYLYRVMVGAASPKGKKSFCRGVLWCCHILTEGDQVEGIHSSYY